MAGKSAAKWFAFGIALLLLATVAATLFELARKPKTSVPKVAIGTKDQVYFSHGATAADALALGQALQNTGFFSDRGASVLVSKGAGGAIVSFVLNDGAWNDPRAVASFEEIGRRIAASIGGFPIRIHLVDASWTEHKSVVVGKAMIGPRDAIYYLGNATEDDAKALGEALRKAGYLADLGVTVVLSKGDGTAIGFVVADGVWDRREAPAAFEQLARRVAASVGGLPVQLRLLNAEMEVKQEAMVR
jgi:hypothetical protein